MCVSQPEIEMEVTKSKEPTQGAKKEQKPELDPASIDELMKGAISGPKI